MIAYVTFLIQKLYLLLLHIICGVVLIGHDASDQLCGSVFPVYFYVGFVDYTEFANLQDKCFYP